MIEQDQSSSPRRVADLLASIERPSNRVVVERRRENGLDWFVVSDEDGEFARATSIEMVLPYVSCLLYGPRSGMPFGDEG